jgi:hypothetical protein
LSPPLYARHIAEPFYVCSQDRMSRARLESINEFARQGYAVRVTCSCGNVSDWNAVLLMGELHRRRQSLAVDEVERRFRCSACGERGATITPTIIDW